MQLLALVMAAAMGCLISCASDAAISPNALSNIASERARPIEVPLIEPQPAAQFSYRILVVDDEPSIRETTRPLLENVGYEVVTANDGLDGLHALSKSLPDVIISDLHMPRMSGFEFLGIVRKRFPHIAIIAMSGEFIPGENLHSLWLMPFGKKDSRSRSFFRKSQGLWQPLQPDRKERRMTSNPSLYAEAVVGI
jgi:CheY-like chemotaxis protein